MPDRPLSELTDQQLQDAAEDAILAAAVMNGSRWANDYHSKVDAIYDECAKRSRGIYQAAWNAAVRSQGHSHMVTPVDRTKP